MHLTLPDGTKWESPSRSQMLYDIDSMNKSFTVGVHISKSSLPPCLAQSLSVLGKGVLGQLKSFLITSLASVDPLIIAAYVYLGWAETQANYPDRVIAEAAFKASEAGKKAYADIIGSITTAMANSAGASGSAVSNATMTAVYTCIPMQSLLSSVENILVKGPATYLHNQMGKLREQATFINDIKLIISWLEARKRFYQNWISSINLYLE